MWYYKQMLSLYGIINCTSVRFDNNAHLRAQFFEQTDCFAEGSDKVRFDFALLALA